MSLFIFLAGLLLTGNPAATQVLWGATMSDDPGDKGVIYTYDVTTGTQTVKHRFGQSNDGYKAYDNLMQASNGKLYGIARYGGANNHGVIYKYDPAADDYEIVHNFNGTDGSDPTSSMIQASNGILYGMTIQGGTKDYGVIYKYNPATNAFNKVHEFDGTDGAYPPGSLMQASNGMLYGMTNQGDLNTEYGVIFKYNPATDVYTNIHYFDDDEGKDPQGSLMQASNGMFYGMTRFGGPDNYGVIFKFDPVTQVYTKIHQFSGTDGGDPWGSLMQASNGLLYGMVTHGGGSDKGVIFKYDPATNVFTKVHNFNGTDGEKPYGSLMQASDDLLYGYTFLGPTGRGNIFSFDISTESCSGLFTFNGTDGQSPYLGRFIEFKVNNALNFDGVDDYVDATANTSGLPEGNDVRTIEAWIKSNGIPSNYDQYSNILSWGSNLVANERSSIGQRVDHLAFVGGSNDLNGSIPISDGNWHHVAVTFDGSVMSLYVDGVLDISAPKTLSTSGQDLRIGNCALPDNKEYWAGAIDEVRIWNTAISHCDILKNMNAELTGSELGLVAYYNFNQGVAGGSNTGVTTLIDKTFNAMDGDLTNFNLSGSTSNWVVSGVNIAAIIINNWTGTIDSDWHTAGNWDLGVVPYIDMDVSISAFPANQPVITSAANCKTLSVETGATLTIASTASATGTLINSLSLCGEVNVERYFTGGGWHLVSSPVSGAVSGVFPGMYLQSFTENNSTWIDVTSATLPMNVMEGYAVYSTLGTHNTVTFTGTPNFGSQSRAFTKIDLGWNMMGNPYTASIDWEAVTIPATMSNEVHYIEASTGNNLSYVKGTGGTGSRYIPPMQGFFVKASAGGTFSLNNNVRTHSGSGTFYKNSNPNLVILQATNGQFTDQAWVHFNEDAGVEHDGTYDAYKRISTSNLQLPQLYSISPGGEMLSINGMPETESVKLGFTAVSSGEFTIGAAQLMESKSAMLEDLKTGIITDLSKESYTFGYKAGDAPERFVLHFNLELAGNTAIYTSGEYIHINSASDADGTVQVYDLTGRLMAETQLTGNATSMLSPGTGVWLVKVIQGTDVNTKKVYSR